MSNGLLIMQKFQEAGMTKAGAAGLLGNLEAESGLSPINLEDAYQSKLGFTDESYVKAVDDGSYKNFVRDSAGFGLAQWTYYTRKAALLAFAKERKVSIGSLLMQVDFCIKEVKELPGLWNVLSTTSSPAEASNKVLFIYENPADQSAGVQLYRQGLAQKWFKVNENATAKDSVKADIKFDTCQAKLPILVKNSSYSESVKVLQTILSMKKYAVCSVDGYFGPATFAALQNFQNSEGLTPDGICGPATWARLIGG